MRKMTLLAAAVLCWPVLAHAQVSVPTSTPAVGIDAKADLEAKKDAARAKWKDLTPEQRAAKKAEMKAKWDAMTPEQKEKFKQEHPRFGQRHDGEGRGKWKDLTPEQRAAKKAEMKAKWDAMTPEQRAEAKAKFAQKHPKAAARFEKKAAEKAGEKAAE